MDSWISLIALTANGVLLGASIVRARVEMRPTFITAFGLSVGSLGIIASGAVLTHKLGLM